MTSCLIDVARFVYVSNVYTNDSSEIYADMILQKTESAPLSYLKLEDFLTWCQKDRLIIELMDLIFQICHVVLGLRPSSQQDEVSIVKYVMINKRKKRN
jgi:ubiquitin carboxyl-terminal hydrolase 6/32